MDILSWFYTVRSYVQTYAHSIKARWLFSLIWALALAPDSNRVVMGSTGAVHVRDFAKGEELLRLDMNRAWVHCVALSPDGRKLAFVSYQVYP